MIRLAFPLHARPSKISFTDYKGYKRETQGFMPLPRTIILRIRADVVFLPVLPGLLFPVLVLHAGGDREGTEGRDAQDHEPGRGEDRDAADEPALQRGVGPEEDRHERERD